MKITSVQALENISKEIRRSTIEQIYNAQSGHTGGYL